MLLVVVGCCCCQTITAKAVCDSLGLGWTYRNIGELVKTMVRGLKTEIEMEIERDRER